MNQNNDTHTTIEQLKKRVAAFVTERDWDQFHSPKNLSMGIAIEASELMEKFLWVDTKNSYDEALSNNQEVKDELADILTFVLAFANATQIDLSDALEKKLIATAQKYPVEKAKGRSTKYNKL